MVSASVLERNVFVTLDIQELIVLLMMVHVVNKVATNEVLADMVCAIVILGFLASNVKL
jgi:multisubunit Na+/H+ antiporter MnhF subunit